MSMSPSTTTASDLDVLRTRLAEGLAERGIGCGIYYPRVAYDYDCYRSHPGVIVETMPVAESVAAQVLSLPVHPFLREADVDAIAAAVRSLMT